MLMRADVSSKPSSYSVGDLQEMSQRDPGGPVQTCIARAEANLRMLLDIPQNYKVLFFQVC